MITKDMLIIDVLAQGDPDKLANVLQESGMHCLHCMLAHGETLEEAANVHGIDADQLIENSTQSAKRNNLSKAKGSPRRAFSFAIEHMIFSFYFLK